MNDSSEGMDDSSKGGLGFLFLYIGIGLALLFTVISGVRAVFGIIDHLVLSDSVGWYQLYRSTELPVSAAFLLVSFLVLFVILRKVRGVTNDYRDTIWYTFCRTIILIIITVSVVMTAVAVSLLFGDLLSGDVSLNSFLKMFFVVGVGLMVFYYHRGVLHGAWRVRRGEERTFVVAVSVLLALIILTAVIVSNPFERVRMERIYKTLNYIQGAYHSVEHFYGDEGYLPVSLDEVDSLKRPHREYIDIDIFYEIVNKKSYRLCASFDALPKGANVPHYPYARFEVAEIGENCFDLTVD